MQRHTLVLGIGNTLLSDEGAGVHAVYRLQRHHPRPDVEYLDGGTLSFALAEAIESCDRLIVIDAAQLNEAPGCTRVFLDREMDAFLAHSRRRSVHEVSLMDLMAVACLAGRLPRERALIAVQPASIDWGEHPTSAIDAALPAVCAHALSLAESWSA